MDLRKFQSIAVVCVVSFICNSSIAGELFNWDFTTATPSSDHSFAFAGQGDPSCLLKFERSNNDEVFAFHDVVNGEAYALLDASAWWVEPVACYSFVQWGYGMEYEMNAVSREFTSGDLSEYSLSFDAWLAGTVDLPGTIRMQFWNEESDKEGKPTILTVLQNSSFGGKDKLGLLPLTRERQSFSFSLDELVEPSESMNDFAMNFNEFTSLGVQLQAEGASGAIPFEATTHIVGFDNDNQLFIDNVKFEGPFTTVGSSCDPESGGDLNGDGSVSFADFLVLTSNFGKSVDDHTGGDSDCDGSVGFTDFLVLTSNFGQTIRRSTDHRSQSVPEPSGSSWFMGWAVLILRRRILR